ncbi:hypothetical protein SLOPH_1709 [Spraguea lophii 42_110]|uniref:Uncharacterized protein n=1 Tax=Spraguea lophii (strain 42_110) TaxID=1358809 RepID=S7WAN8_SPRLO|nr:hypothetical protein SLOPH_1709 [Spraguea lophii 42_110]
MMWSTMLFTFFLLKMVYLPYLVCGEMFYDDVKPNNYGAGIDNHHNVAMDNHHGEVVPLHGGDTGLSGVILTRDVLHHPGKGIFVGMKGKTPLPVAEGMGLDDLHEKIADNKDAAHKASIARKIAEMKKHELDASIAAEMEQQKKEEMERLKNLDLQIAKSEHVKPETLGKHVIPVAVFTQESFPLIHHLRDVMKKIKSIQAAEYKAIESQEHIARLDDITDQLPPPNPILETPEFYQKFFNAANLPDAIPSHVPVFGTPGNFYIGNNPDQNAHAEIAGPGTGEYESPEGHGHYVGHGS